MNRMIDSNGIILEPRGRKEKGVESDMGGVKDTHKIIQWNLYWTMLVQYEVSSFSFQSVLILIPECPGEYPHSRASVLECPDQGSILSVHAMSCVYL